jgi:hypothetical protein
MTAPLAIPLPPTAGWTILAGPAEFGFGETRELDEFAIARLPAHSRRVAFIPAASGSNEYAVHLGTYLRGIDPTVEVVNVPIYRTRDARRERNLALLRDSGMIYIGAGVTNTLVEAMRRSPAVEAIRYAIDGGSVLFAIGAGASALGVKTSNMRIPGNLLDGIGFFTEMAVETTSFDPTYDARLKRLAAMPEVHFAVGIPRLTALAISPERIGQVLGSGQIGLIRKPITS